jgi:hypothetical protein
MPKSTIQSSYAGMRTETPKTRQEDGRGVSSQLNGAKHALEKSVADEARNTQEQKEAGMLQLVICVGGIYASLYALDLTHTPAHPRPFF